MEKITIGFSYHKNNLVSKAIQTVEGSSYSHVFIRRKSKYGEYVYQASGLAVNFTNIDIFLEENVIVEEYEFDLPDDQRDDLIGFFIKYAGAKYELKALLSLFLIIMARRININLKFEGDPKKFYCSKLAAFFCESILGIDIPTDINFTTPTDMNPIMRQYGRRVR